VPLTDLFVVACDSSIPYNSVYGRNFNFSIPAGSYTGITFGIGMPSKIADTITNYHLGINDPLNLDYGFEHNLTSNGPVYGNIDIIMFVDTSKAQNVGCTKETFFT